MTTRTITTTVANFLDLINCAEDYGHNNQVIMSAFADFLERHVPDDEISGYLSTVLSDANGYGPEDRADASYRLRKWRGKWCQDGSSVRHKPAASPVEPTE